MYSASESEELSVISSADSSESGSGILFLDNLPRIFFLNSGLNICGEG